VRAGINRHESGAFNRKTSVAAKKALPAAYLSGGGRPSEMASMRRFSRAAAVTPQKQAFLRADHFLRFRLGSG
jgi:hypothetical protein